MDQIEQVDENIPNYNTWAINSLKARRVEIIKEIPKFVGEKKQSLLNELKEIDTLLVPEWIKVNKNGEVDDDAFCNELGQLCNIIK